MSSKTKVLIGVVLLCVGACGLCGLIGMCGGPSDTTPTPTKTNTLVPTKTSTTTPIRGTPATEAPPSTSTATVVPVVPTATPAPDKNMDACIRAAMEVLYKGPDAQAGILVCVDLDIGTYEECAKMLDDIYREVATEKCLEMGY